jgi:hypothetical protein
MVCRDYCKELGLDSGPKKLSKPATVAVLVCLGVGMIALVVAIARSGHSPAVASAAPRTQAVASGQ